MRARSVEAILLLLLALVLGGMFVAGWSGAPSADQVEEPRLQTKTTTWQSGGNEHSVSTVRDQSTDPIESLEDWCRRHDEAVAASQKMHPPD